MDLSSFRTSNGLVETFGDFSHHWVLLYFYGDRFYYFFIDRFATLRVLLNMYFPSLHGVDTIGLRKTQPPVGAK